MLGQLGNAEDFKAKLLNVRNFFVAILANNKLRIKTLFLIINIWKKMLECEKSIKTQK